MPIQQERDNHQQETGIRIQQVVFLLALLLLVMGCGKVKYTWGWYVFNPVAPKGRENIYLMLSGLQMTFLVTLTALVGTQIVGFILALMRLAKSRPLQSVPLISVPFTKSLLHNPLKFLLLLLRSTLSFVVYYVIPVVLNGVSAVYLELFRNIPLFVLLFAVYYVAPILVGLSLSAFQALVLAIMLNNGAFVCEIFRAGIASISRGHIEAARSLGMSSWQTMKRIVLPQATRRMLPALANNSIVLAKDSALGAGLAVEVLDRQALFLDTLNYRPFEIWTFVALEYLLLLLLLSQCVKWIEKKMVIV